MESYWADSVIIYRSTVRKSYEFSIKHWNNIAFITNPIQISYFQYGDSLLETYHALVSYLCSFARRFLRAKLLAHFQICKSRCARYASLHSGISSGRSRQWMKLYVYTYVCVRVRVLARARARVRERVMCDHGRIFYPETSKLVRGKRTCLDFSKIPIEKLHVWIYSVRLRLVIVNKYQPFLIFYILLLHHFHPSLNLYLKQLIRDHLRFERRRSSRFQFYDPVDLDYWIP